MKLHIDPEWLRRKIAEEPDLEGCAYCGALAGCCANYPDCPGGQTTMTTKVLIVNFGPDPVEVMKLIPVAEANATAEARSRTTLEKHEPYTADQFAGSRTLNPQETLTDYVHSGQYFEVREKRR